MPQYLIFAENIYKRVKEEEIFSDDSIENMNNLMKLIRNEIEGTEFKLKYKFIDFGELFSKPLDECKIKIDISLIPNFNQQDEYILWLASFVEKITEGGPRSPPPIKQHIPEFLSFASELDFVNVPEGKNFNKGEEITEYFNSKAFTKHLKK